MAHLPTTIRGRISALLLFIAAIPIAVWLAVSLSGPVVWITLALIAIAVIALFARRRQLDAARESAYVGAFSFGDVNRRIHAEEALAVSAGALTGKRGWLPTRVGVAADPR